MDFVDIIVKQIEKQTNRGVAEISYYESIPLKQIHMDTFFYNNKILNYPYPFLVIVDIATRYVNIVPQKRKNENVLLHVDNFCREVRDKFPTAEKINSKVLIITDGAKEFNVVKSKYRHKLSVSIHKAAIAESVIGRIKVIVRKVILKKFIETIYDKKLKTIPTKTLLDILRQIQFNMNKKAKIYKRDLKSEKDVDAMFKLGDPVFVKSHEKFYTSLRKLKKKSYLDNYITEPFFVSDIIFYNGIYKYEITSWFDFSIDKYYYYTEQMQLITPNLAKDYIMSYRKAYKSKYVKESKILYRDKI